MTLTYKKREDGKERANIAVWVHPTKEQVAAIQKPAESAGYSRWRQFLRDIAEKAIEQTIASQGK